MSEASNTEAELFDSFLAKYKKGKYYSGLLLAFLDLIAELDVFGKFDSAADFLKAYPPIPITRGRDARTLAIAKGDGSRVSLRQLYQRRLGFFRDEHNRGGYPVSPAQASQNWERSLDWLDQALRLDKQTADGLAERVVQHVLADLPRGPGASRSSAQPKLEQKFEIPTGYEQAAFSILSYFSQVLRDRELSDGTRVSIVQQDMTISMRIETTEGQREEVEQLLTDYLDVVGQRAPMELVAFTELERVRLQYQLENTLLQLKMTHHLLAISTGEVGQLKERVLSLEADRENSRLMSGLLSALQLQMKSNSDLARTLQTLSASQAPREAELLHRLVDLVSSGEPSPSRIEEARPMITAIAAEPSLRAKVETAVAGAAGALAVTAATTAGTLAVTAASTAPTWLPILMRMLSS